MVLTSHELVSSLQTEARILQHLLTKLDDRTLDYRPTPSQRSGRELVTYLSMMGPTLVQFGLAETPTFEMWTEAEKAAAARTYEETVATINQHGAHYEELLGNVPDEVYRAPFVGFDGQPTTRGAFINKMVVSGSAAYRMQLFLYLKSCGHPLTTSNLWRGTDAAVA
ncbi:MAG: hypothetical protein V4617_03730 [Gemmatimonadota bacterium]